MKEKKEIVIYQDKTALDIFQPDGVATILAMVRAEVTDFKPDTSTDKGRKEIASKAYQASQAKTRLETAGKDLVSEWKEKAKAVDEQRKELRDGLDSLRDEVRQPLTDWEEDEKERVEAEALAKQVAEKHDEALAENDLFDRQKEIERQEAELGAQKQAQLDKELAERLEKEKVEREASIRAEVIEQEKKTTAARLQKAEDEKIQALADAKFEAEKAEREKNEAVEAARKEEYRRIAEMQAEEKRVRDVEEAKLAKIAQGKAHQKAVNNTAVQCLEMSTGVDTETAKKIITAIAKGDIASVTINY